MTPETEIEVLKNEILYLKEKVKALFKIVKEHMEKEEIEREEIDNKLAQLIEDKTKRKAFAAGIVATTSIFWVVVIAGVTIYLKVVR